MVDPVESIKAAVLALEDDELTELRRFADAAYGSTAGLLAALAHAADWEWHRRQGINFDMSHPEQAIEPEELGACLAFVPALSAEFPHAPRVRILLAEIARVLSGGTRH